MGNKKNKCCCPGCMIGQDLFNRPDELALGIAWDEEGVGNWGVAGNVAYMTPGEFIAIFQVPHKKLDESMEVKYEIIDEVDDAEYHILVNVVDNMNYHIAKFVNSSAPYVELGVVSGGVYLSLTSLPVVGMTGPAPCDHMARNCRTFYARIAPDEFCAGIGQAVLSMVTAAPSIKPGGTKSGIGGKVDSGIIEMDNFYFGEHLETNRECPTCICQCEDTVIGHKLIAEFSGNGRMAGIDGCTVELNWVRESFWWTGEVFCCGQLWVIEVYCANTEPFPAEQFKLRVITGCINSDTDITEEGYISPGYREALSLESTCDPFYLKFGPFNVTTSDLACGCGSGGPPPFGDGEYYLEVTKATV
jgi:hypothetical protein